MKWLHLIIITRSYIFPSCILHRQLWWRDLPAGQSAGQQSRQQQLLREEHQAGWIRPPRNRNCWTRYSWPRRCFISHHYFSSARRWGYERHLCVWAEEASAIPGSNSCCWNFCLSSLHLPPFTAPSPCLSGPVYVFKVFLLAVGGWPLHPVGLRWRGVFLHRHVCPHLFEEESPGGETAGRGQHSGLHPHHSPDSSTWHPPPLTADRSPFCLSL